MSRRWGPFLVALGASAALAVGVGVATTRLVAGAEMPPRLRTVPYRTLSAAGISVAAPSQPPYCGVERDAAQRGWTSSGIAGCAISQSEAQGALLPVVQGHVTEAVLARVSGPATSDIGSDQLVWMLVVKSSQLVLPTDACGPPRASGPACAAGPGRMGPVSTEAVVLVDALNGQVLMTVPVPATAATATAGPAG